MKVFEIMYYLLDVDMNRDPFIKHGLPMNTNVKEIAAKE
jgi:hypothetical protein